MRWLILTGLALLITVVGCPVADKQAGTGPGHTTTGAGDTGSTASAPATGDVPYPACAVDYLAAGLEQPVEDNHPALNPCWLTVARLSYADTAPAAAPLRAAIEINLNQARDQLLPPLCAAWLAVEPEPAVDWLAEHVAAGDYQYFDSLWHDPVRGAACLDRLDVAGLGDSAAQRFLLLIRHWGNAVDFVPQLEVLSGSESEPVRLLATGLLLSAGAGTPEHRQLIRDAIDDYQRLSNVAEAVKLSRDPELAEDLVKLAAQAELGEIDPGVRQHQVSLAAYALTTLPGGQAELMRNNLLGAKDEQVRWQARLGQLLNGKPDTFVTAVTTENIGDQFLWVALQPEDVVSPDLLGTLATAARSGEPAVRAQAAIQLNRYAAYASNDRVRQILEKLVADPEEEVRTAAWYSAGTIGLPSLDDAAETMLNDEQQPPEVRLAAAYYLLRLAEIPAEGGDPE